MFRPLVLAALLSLPAVGVQANSHSDQLYALVSRELPSYVNDADASALDRHQLAAIYSIMHSSQSQGDKTGLIRSVLGGRFSLRSLFFK